MKAHKTFSLMLVFVFSISLLGLPAQVLAQEPALAPHISVMLETNGNAVWISGEEWPLGEIVTIIIDDPNTLQSPDFTTQATASNIRPGQVGGSFQYSPNYYKVLPGFTIIVSDGNTTRSLVVSDLLSLSIDDENNWITGKTMSNREIWVVANNVTVETQSDNMGDWLADFKGKTDLQSDVAVEIKIFDDEGDLTDWHKRGSPVPYVINAGPNQGFVYGHNWPSGILVQMIVIRSGNTIYTSVATVGPCGEGNPGLGPCDPNSVYFDLGYWDSGMPRIDLLPGDTIILTGGGITRSMIVSALLVIGGNISTSIVTGTADVGKDVYITNGGTSLVITPDSSGYWTANFAFSDLLSWSGPMLQFDENGNWTQQVWTLPKPNFIVRANYDQIEAYQWDMGDTLTLEIDNPDTAANPDYTTTKTVTDVAAWDPKQTYVWLDLSGEYDIQIRDVVSISDGLTKKTTVVTNLTITDVHPGTGIAEGMAEPNQIINVWTCWQDTCANRDETADQNGYWATNFIIPGEQDWEQGTLNIQPGSWIDSSVEDEDGDSTMFGWYVPINTTPPTITWVSNISNGYNYYFDFVPSEPTCTASDLSGVDGSCTVTGYSTTIGVHTLTATARDMSGNVATETRSYTVLPWTLKGFYQPVDMNGVYNIIKGGRTVPLKFEIFAGSTELTGIAYIKSLTYAQTSCDANATTDEIETIATGGTSLRYADGQFIYNWKTPNTAGCYRVTMATIDGSSLSSYFKLK